MSSRSPVTSESRFSQAIGFTSVRSVVAGLVLLGLAFWFISGGMYRFYASVLFYFYSLTERMWVSVIMLGVFQTLVLVPLRIVRVSQGDHIREFQEQVEEMESVTKGKSKFKEDFSLGNFTFLFYLIDFFVQISTFMTIGRLFLTDFYSKLLREGTLYVFVPYPDYPIKATYFKIPYVAITKTLDLGWGFVLIAWSVAFLLLWLVWLGRYVWKKMKDKPTEQSRMMETRYYYGYLLILFGVSYVLMRHLPVGFEPRLFVGDVSRPNRTLNTITAIMTFVTLLWFGYRKIRRKVGLAREAGVDEKVMEVTTRKMFSQLVFDASVVGLGAFFITNHIPSAFELSIFTLELISLSSPLTLDKLILVVSRKMKK